MGEDESDAGLDIAGAIREGAAVLKAAGVGEARRDAGLLLAHVTGRDRAYLITHSEEALTGGQLSAFRACVARRAAGEPLQYVTGRQEFYGLDFEVTPDVLIPRPETELLVEWALEVLKDTPRPAVCDVGTGSGCVAVALLHARPDAHAFAVDISPAAVRVAARNAARHGVGGRLVPTVSDCFEAFGRHPGPPFDLVVSNPPYVAEEEMEGLQREVRDHEPRQALTPGGDGLSVIRRLVEESPTYIKPGGHLLFEIGFGQHESIPALIDPRVWTLLGIRQDLQGIPRTVGLRRTE